jgi:uncharacterized protein (UPF0332 family)
MDKAFEALDDARANLEEGRYKTSVNRSYYAVLNAVRAVLILEGVNPKTHEGALTMLSLRLVRPGLLSKEFVKNFELLLSRRTEVDYGDLGVIDSIEAEDSYNIAKAMVSALNELRKKMTSSLRAE